MDEFQSMLLVACREAEGGAKMKTFRKFIFLAMLMIGLSFPILPVGAEAPLMGDGSVYFIENVGQFAEQARYLVLGATPGIYLAKDAIWYTLNGPVGRTDDLTAQSRWQANIKVSFVGLNPEAQMEPFNRLVGHFSYFRGAQDTWRSNVPIWGGVRFIDLYPGIDLEVTGDGHRLVQRLICRENCPENLAQVRLRIEGAQAAALAVHRGGQTEVALDTPAGRLDLPLLSVASWFPAGDPRINRREGQPIELENPFTRPAQLNAASAAPSTPDSRLLYSTFLGGDNGGETSYDIQVDASGAAYVVGGTNSDDFPVTPGAITKPGIDFWGEVFVAKFNPSGSALDYAAILGGSEDDQGLSIDIDSQGYAYITGSTDSPDFPTTSGAFDRSCGTDGNCNNTESSLYPDGFVAKLNPSGSVLIYSTFIGGEDSEGGEKIDVLSGQAYVIGNTQSDLFPTTPGTMDHGCQNFGTFVVKLNSAGSGLVYSTFMPSTYCPFGACALAVDSSGHAFLTGTANLSLFPFTPGAFDTTYGTDEAYIAKLKQDGTGVEYATFVGGSGIERAWDIAVDANGYAYLVGSTESSDFATTLNAYDRTCGNDGKCLDGSTYPRADIFVVKMNLNGTGILYGTYLGGSDTDCTTFATIEKDCSIAVDAAGNVYISGGTDSSDFPITSGAVDTHFEGYSEAFVVKLNPAGSTLDYGTLLGGWDEETGHGVTADGSGMVYVTGGTGSDDFPVTAGSFDPYIDWLDSAVFVSKLDLRSYTTVSATIPATGGTLVSDSDRTSYVFPAGTFSEAALVTHTSYAQGSAPSTGLLAGINHFFSTSAVYSGSGNSADPLQPFTITLTYTDAELNGIDEDTLGFYAWDGQIWVKQAGSVLDTALNAIAMTESDFKFWAVLGQQKMIYLPVVQR
jgi:hypothetical protein